MSALALGASAALLARRAHLRRARSFEGKRVLITGGSRGLGLVLARRFAAEGARIALLARDADELGAAVDDVARQAAAALGVTCDLRDASAIPRAIQLAADGLGGIDVLVNNAGSIVVGPVQTMSLDDFEESLAVHLYAPLITTMAALPYLRRSDVARVVNIASIGGRIAVPHLLPYTVGKFALVGLSDGLRAELRREKVLVTTVAPGLIRTGSPQNAFFKGRHREEFAWFAIGDSLPLLSVSAERAARKVVEACRRGAPRLTIGMAARAAALTDAVVPGLTARIAALASRMLPDAGEASAEMRRGAESASPWAPSLLTTLSDRAAVRNNEEPAQATEEGGPAA